MAVPDRTRTAGPDLDRPYLVTYLRQGNNPKTSVTRRRFSDRAEAVAFVAGLLDPAPEAAAEYVNRFTGKVGLAPVQMLTFSCDIEADAMHDARFDALPD